MNADAAVVVTIKMSRKAVLDEDEETAEGTEGTEGAEGAEGAEGTPEAAATE